MTKQERKECKDLVEEAKKQSAEDTTGNNIYRAVVVVRSKAINHLPGGGPDKYHRAVSPFSFILRTRLAYDVSTNLER